MTDLREPAETITWRTYRLPAAAVCAEFNIPYFDISNVALELDGHAVVVTVKTREVAKP